jgi:hypothetical protein
MKYVFRSKEEIMAMMEDGSAEEPEMEELLHD